MNLPREGYYPYYARVEASFSFPLGGGGLQGKFIGCRIHTKKSFDEK